MVYDEKFILQLNKVKKMIVFKMEEEPQEGVLNLLYEKYSAAIKVVEASDSPGNIHILGGMRAYADATFKYQSALTNELGNTEQMLTKILKDIN